jgi:hypothetical protein
MHTNITEHVQRFKVEFLRNLMEKEENDASERRKAEIYKFG